jgi:hypothetical protein
MVGRIEMAKRSRSERRASVPNQVTPPDDQTQETEPIQDAPTPDVAQAAPVTRELTLPETAEERAEAQPDVTASFASDAHADDGAMDEFDAGATREAAVVPAPGDSLNQAEPPPLDPDATVVRERPQELDFAEEETAQQPVQPPLSRPKFNTLAGAFSRSRSTPPTDQATPMEPPTPPAPDLVSSDTYAGDVFGGDEVAESDGLADETDPEGEWALADQPTVHLTQEELQALKPSFLDTSERPASWPPRPAEASVAPELLERSAHAAQNPTPPPPAAAPQPQADPRDWRAGLPPRPQPPFDLSAGRPAPLSERLAAPDGRPMRAPDPESGAPDYRMERFQELRRHRTAHEHGDEATDDVTPVAEAVRQWWHDLRPGVGDALEFQREARESGTHPLPAFAPPPPTSRLGDAFGKLAASARGVSERAQQVAGPALKRIHDQVEHAAQGFIDRFEPRQQAPFLGPGRIAVFFRRGVTVGQAQRLLAASSARPMRLIPRKHGILAQVMPGNESEVSDRLRQHPYVDDVVYMEYGERA